jgi:hypothetical protein
MSKEAKKRGFAAMDPERLRQIASSGGIARKRVYESRRRNGQERGVEPQPEAAPRPGARS